MLADRHRLGTGEVNHPSEVEFGVRRRQSLHSIPVLLARVLANPVDSAMIRLDRWLVT
jgi:hypothetical protein